MNEGKECPFDDAIDPPRYVRQAIPTTDKSTEYSSLFKILLESNSMLHKEIRKLKKDHQKNMSSFCQHQVPGSTQLLEWSHNTQDELSSRSCPAKIRSPDIRDDNSMAGDSTDELNESDATVIAEGESCEDGEEIGDIGCFDMEEDNHSVKEVSPKKFHSSTTDDGETISYSGSDSVLSQEVGPANHYESPGMLVIKQMWNDFSVDDYNRLLIYNSCEEMTSVSEQNQNTKQNTKKWTRKITIPQPFAMTVREATTPHKKSRSMLRAEQECVEREAAEEAEMIKQFHANPIPANTFLPLYELMKAKNELRREHIKATSAMRLEASMNPFKFMKREEAKQQKKMELLKMKSQELKKGNTQFKAKPAPPKYFASEVQEEFMEKEAYRKICIKMRAEELMAKSKMPSRMEEDMCKKKNNKPTHQKITKRFQFRPKISHKIPDYDKAFSKFKKELEKKKQSKLTTITEPFHLHTEALSTKRTKARALTATNSLELEVDQSPKTYSLNSSPTPVYPHQMTETAKLRLSLTQNKLADLLQQEIIEEDNKRNKREQQKILQRSVAKKSHSLDPEEMRRAKLQLLRYYFF